MIRVFADPRADPHHEALLLVWPGTPRDKGNPEYNKRRDLGKRANFLTIYRGGPGALVQTVRKFMGLEISYDLASDIIEKIWAGRQGLFQWQEGLIADASKQGYLELFTGWRRTFVRSQYLVESTYISEVCNFPVQGYAAQIVQSAQTAIRQECTAQGLTYCMPCQSHDDVLLDAPPRDIHAVDAIARKHMKDPPLWKVLCDSYGRYVPMDFAAKVLDSPRPQEKRP